MDAEKMSVCSLCLLVPSSLALLSRGTQKMLLDFLADRQVVAQWLV